MKYQFKTILFFIFFSFSFNSFSQILKNDIKEIKEIKLILKEFNENRLKLPFYLSKDGYLIISPYFTSFRDFYLELKNGGNWSQFSPTKIYDLNLSDCYKLNDYVLNDTVRLYIEKDWFKVDNIKILSDSDYQNQKGVYGKFVKPVFFRNYTRCLIAVIYPDSMDSFFLKKVNNHWIFDKFYLRYENDRISN